MVLLFPVLSYCIEITAHQLHLPSTMEKINK
jgi:hypothetical protein